MEDKIQVNKPFLPPLDLYQEMLADIWSRNWLTNLPSMFFNQKIDPKVTKIINSLGIEPYIGATMNVLETLLLISCKDMGVSCLFEPEFSLDFLQQSKADLIIDATAGKLDHLYPSIDKRHEIEASCPGYDFSASPLYTVECDIENPQSYAGLRLIEDIKKPSSFKLKPDGARFYPYVGESKLFFLFIKCGMLCVYFQLDKGSVKLE